ncbi:MAG TPA: YqaA family protein [Longimicrobiales bacterium]|nr:YqaA family protein [Longimicrobiales bacterium]
MTQTTPETDAAPRSRNPVRRLYDWMLAWADRPSGPAALGVISFAESSFFPIPPDPLLLALCLGRPRRALLFGAICTLGSVLGGMFGYMLGHLAWSGMEGFFFSYVPGVTPEAFARVQGWYDRWGFWAVFLAGFTPLPYKVFTLSSGVFGISFPVFLIASTVSRGLRFFIIATLVYFYGPPIARFIDKYFDKLALLFGVLLIGGLFLLKFMH